MKMDVNEITKEDFKEALETVLNGKVTNLAPLGFSGDDVYLYDNRTIGVSHSGCVKIRTWSNMPEMLIGNKAGRWLCLIKIDRVMGFDYILNEFHRQFENVKHMIDGFDKDDHKQELAVKTKHTSGFAILEAATRYVEAKA